MPLKVTELTDKDQTAAEMYRLVDQYAGDLDEFNVNGTPLSQTALPTFYDAIRAVPYRKDTTGVEVVTRPYVLLTAPMAGWDCKKKAIAIASWLKLHGTRYRFVATSRRPDGEIHHVFTQGWIDGEWVDIDPTYPRNNLFEREHWTKVEPLAGSGSATDQAVLVSLSGEGAPGPALTWEFVRAVNHIQPEFLGAPLTAAGIVSIIVSAIGAAVAITATIVSAVQTKRERESRERTEAVAIQSYQDIQIAALEASTTQQQVAVQQQTDQAALIKKWILPAGIALGALVFLT